jgi:HSP20 family protein
MSRSFDAFTRWDPFAEIQRLQDEIGRRTGGRSADFAPPVDIMEERDAIVLRADLPGVKPEDVRLTVENGVLTIAGERHFQKTSEHAGARRVESGYGTFSRSFTLPTSVVSESIEASSEHGVLTVRVPKRAEVQPRRIPVAFASTPKANVVANESPSPAMHA